jgi:hypothetical protein
LERIEFRARTSKGQEAKRASEKEQKRRFPMFKRFGILSLVLAGATLLQPAAMFADGVFHNGRNTTVVERRGDERRGGERGGYDRRERNFEARRVEGRSVRYRQPVYRYQGFDRRAEYCR